MNFQISGQKFMQVNWDSWLPQYYPKYNPRAFQACLKEIGEWGLPTEEFQYIVLGCGYLFHVRELDPETALGGVKRQLSGKLDWQTADLILNEKAIKKHVKRLGLVIGPEKRPLKGKPNQGPRPCPAAWIAALAIDIWIKRQRPEMDPAELACDLYYALSGRSIQPLTFARKQKEAEQMKVKEYTPEERDLSAIENLVGFFEHRYKRFKKEGFPLYLLERYSHSPERFIENIYPISGVMDSVLKAVGVDLPTEKSPFDGLFVSGQGFQKPLQA